MDTANSSSDRDPLERLADEYLDRRRRGENPSPAEYAERYPEWAAAIVEYFPALELMEGLKPGAHDRTSSFAGRGRSLVAPQLERLGEYRILREIGRGGMGVVYEAVQETLGRRVALKILPLHGRVDPVQMERFQLESRSAARLHHTGIVPVYGVGEHGGVHYFAMQYIQGHGVDVVLDDLRRLRVRAAASPASANGEARTDDTGSMAVARSLLTGRFAGSQADAPPVTVAATSAEGHADEPSSRTDRPASPAGISSVLSQSSDSSYFRAIARLCSQVAHALAHAHAQGVLHRDIKPSNLLIDVGGHVWITDFGLAKLEGSEGPTHTGDIVGTLRYMAPERFEGWSDRRSDVYGLGMTLYELLTLRPAFDAATRAKLIEQVIHDPPQNPRKCDPRVPRDLETIVMKAIAKEPSQRYSTADALAADLENFLADKPILARRSGPVERTWRWCRRNPAIAGLLAASSFAALALVAVVVGLIDNARVRASERRSHEAEKKAVALAESEQRLGYIHQIVLAEREWSGNNMPAAEQLLDACAPERRGWEWRYLKRLCHSEMLTLRGHEGIVWSADFSPDGRRIASAGADHTVKLWDATTGNLLKTIKEFEAEVYQVAYSSDGARLAAISGRLNEPGQVVIWDTQTGKELRTIPTPSGTFQRVAFSRDGRRIAASAASSAENTAVIVCDASTGAVERAFAVAPDKVLDLSFSPDGNQLAAAFGSNETFELDPRPGKVRVWDLTLGDEYVLDDQARPLLTLDWSPNGQQIATGGWDRVVKIWDLKSRRVVQALRGHRGNIFDLAFSHDGHRLVSASFDSTAKIWDPATGEELITLRGHRSPMNGLAFSRDRQRVVTSSDDGTVKIWDATAGQESRPIRAHRGPTTSVAFHPCGQYLLSASADKTLKVWNASTGRMVHEFSGSTKPIMCAIYSTDGNLIASAGGDWEKPGELGEVILWNAATGGIIHAWDAHRSVAWCVSFSPDGSQLASAGGELKRGPGDLMIWDCATFQIVQSIPVSGSCGIHAVAFSPDGACLASSDIDGNVALWNPQTGERLKTLKCHKAGVFEIAFDAAGKKLVSASADNTLAIWDLAATERPQLVMGHADQVVKGVFSPDGYRLISASTNGSVKVWDVPTRQELLSLRGNLETVVSVAISPDGERIASASNDGIVRIWDAEPRGEATDGER
jgi:WD40 repeat protein/serine/threonine protein kinase